MNKKIFSILIFIVLFICLSTISSYAAISATSKTVNSGQSVSISISSNIPVLSYKIIATDYSGLTLINSSGGTGAGSATITDAKDTGMTSLATYTFKVPEVTEDKVYSVKFSASIMEDENFNYVPDDTATANITVKAPVITTPDPVPENPDTNTGSNSGETDPIPQPDTNTGTTIPDANDKPTTSTDINTQTKSSDATLKNLGIRPNDFSGFRKNTTTYNHEVPNEVDKVEVYAEVSEKNAKIISGTGVQNIKEGLNVINVVVEAEDGTKKTYKINLTRKDKEEEVVEEEKKEEETVLEETIGLSSLTIQGIKLSPSFDSKVYNYTAKLTEDLEKLEIKTEGTLEKSKIEITGNENLKDGENIITIIVTNDDTEEIATYQIIVNKEVEEIVATVGDIENNEDAKQSIPKIYLILAAIIVVAIIVLLIILKGGNSKKKDIQEDFEEEVNDLENNMEFEEFTAPQELKNPFEEQEINFNKTERDNSTVEKIFGKKGKHS